MAFTYVQVTHDYDLANQVGALGVIEFRPVEKMTNGGTSVPTVPILAPLAAGGVLTQTLAATTDSDTWPSGVRYRVTERLTGAWPNTYFISVPHNAGSTLSLSSLIEESKQTSTGLYPSIPVTMTPISGILTPNAALGSGPFRHTATTDVTLASPINGVDGQEVVVEIYAAGGARQLSFPTGGPTPVLIAQDTVWSGRMRFNASLGEQPNPGQWLLDDDFGASGAVGTGNTTGSAAYWTADPTGLSDVAPVLQALYDSGATSVSLAPGGVYLLNSAVFLDSGARERRFVIDGNGATILLGASLPAAAEFTYDSGTRWAIFPNTLRSALSSGTVTATGNIAEATDTDLLPPALVVRNVVVDGQGANRGLIFGNYASAQLDAVVCYQAKTLLSWTNYADANTLRNCRISSPFGADAWLVIQDSAGDGLVIDGCQSIATAGTAFLRGNTGATIRSNVGGGIYLDRCRGVVISGAHIEAHGSGRTQTPVWVRNSHVVIDGSEIWTDRQNRWGAIVVDDGSASENHTDLVIRDTVMRDVLPSATTGDVTAGPLVSVTAANQSTRVRGERVSGSVALEPQTTHWRTGPRLSSSVVAVQTALTAGLHHLATGKFQLQRRGTVAGGGWEVVGISHSGATFTRLQTTPEVAVAVGGDAYPTGSLTNSQLYEYAVAALDAAGNYTTVITGSATATTKGSLRLLGTVPTSPCRIVVWRRTGAGVAATPDRYVVLPHDGQQFRFYDCGTTINMVPWVTTSVPVPNTVAATNGTRQGILLEGGGLLYVSAGALVYRGSSGTVTTLGNA